MPDESARRDDCATQGFGEILRTHAAAVRRDNDEGRCMNADDRFDFGTRSNDSQFAGLDEPQPWREAEPAPRPALPAGEALAFRVAIVETDADLQRVQALREAAYGHHLPKLAAHFGQPDPVDRWPDVTIFFAEDKATRRVVGSARLQCNRHAPLQIERSITLPVHLRGRSLGEITRLTVLAGYPHPVKVALVKAVRLYCVALQIGGIVCASRPSLMRQYVSLGFEDLYGDERLVPMAHGSNLEHRVRYRDTVGSEGRNGARQQPGDDFFFRSYHPDIVVFDGLASAPERLRQGLVERRRYSRAA
jgi:hypothetical protein